MSKRKRILVLFYLSAIAVIGLWMSLRSIDRNSDEVHHRNLKRYGDSHFRIQAVEQRLPAKIVTFLHLPALKTRCGEKADAEREALIASGFLVRVEAKVTNLETRTEEVNRIGGDPESLMIFDTRSNHVTVICRPQFAPHYRQALSKLQ